LSATARWRCEIFQPLNFPHYDYKLDEYCVEVRL
jgi:hypothetical protein